MNQTVRQARAKNTPIYALAWHVDYWDRTRTRHGVWADPYSSKESTERQKRYIKAVPAEGQLRGLQITPQILVDGRHPQSFGRGSVGEVIQSRVGKARSAAVYLRRSAKGVEWAVKGIGKGNEILVAVVQRDIKQKVTAGENRGKTLEHENVVRWHKITELTKDNLIHSLEVSLPEGVAADAASVIAVVQDSKSMEVHAVTMIDWH